MKLTDNAINHPVVTGILIISLIFFGIISFNSLRQEMFPDVFLPSLIILTVYPGVGAEDVEKEVTSPIEDILATLPGLNKLSSSSMESVSMIEVGFNWGINIDLKLPEVREKLNSIADQLPTGLSGIPSIIKMDPSKLPVMSVILESPMNRSDLTSFFEKQIQSRFSRIDGVSQVNLHGGEKRAVIITLHPDLVNAKKISVLQVFQILKYYNISFPGGNVQFKGANINFRTMGEFKSIDEIRDLVVGYNDNSFIRMRDIADVELDQKVPDEYTTSLGNPAIVVDIMKQQGKSTLFISNNLKAEFSRIEKEFNGLIKFRVISDQGHDIQVSNNTVRDAAVTGALLSVLVVLFFLRNFRATIIIGTAIPVSLLFSFIAMNLFHKSFNLLTLCGLTVAIGMLVDLSVVVLENVYKHYQKTGNRMQSISEGTAEVAGALIGSTTTSMVVFTPLLFAQGLAGLILNDIAFTILVTHIGSLLTAIIVVPLIASFVLSKKDKIEHYAGSEADVTAGDVASGQSGESNGKKGRKLVVVDLVSSLFKWLSDFIGKLLFGLDRFYRKVLTLAIANRAFVFSLAITILVISVIMIDLVGFEFFAESDLSEIEIKVHMPKGYSLDQTREKVMAIEQIIKDNVPEVENSYFFTGRSDSFGIGGSPSEAYGKIKLVNRANRKRSVFEIIKQLQDKINSTIPDIDLTVSNGGLGTLVAIASGGQGFQVEVYGTDFQKLYEAAKLVQKIVGEDPAIMKTNINVSFDTDEILSNLKLDVMGNLGLTPYEAAMTTRAIFHGLDAGKYRGSGEDLDIFLTSDMANSKISSDVLNRLSLRTQNGKDVSFASFSTISVQPAISEISHRNRLKSIVVTGLMSKPDMRGLQNRVLPKIQQLAFPIGVNWEVIGSAKEQGESFKSLFIVLCIGIFLVYVVMVIQFEKFSHPLIIMGSIPFVLIGVVAGLLVGGSTLSIVSFLGLITLAGTVTSNAIVLIDFINMLRSKYKLSLYDAIIEGGSSRLRPILITSLATILGVIPMALGLGEGSEIYAPLGQVIGAGLATSTLITLFLIPSIYYTFENRKLKKTGDQAETGIVGGEKA